MVCYKINRAAIIIAICAQRSVHMNAYRTMPSILYALWKLLIQLSLIYEQKKWSTAEGIKEYNKIISSPSKGGNHWGWGSKNVLLFSLWFVSPIMSFSFCWFMEFSKYKTNDHIWLVSGHHSLHFISLSYFVCYLYVMTGYHWSTHWAGQISWRCPGVVCCLFFGCGKFLNIKHYSLVVFLLPFVLSTNYNTKISGKPALSKVVVLERNVLNNSTLVQVCWFIYLSFCFDKEC